MADRIVLKDGTIEQSDKVWESDNYCHFFLKGTKNVEIRYAEAIVDHIKRVTSDQSHRKVIPDSVMAVAPARKNPAADSQNTERADPDGDNPSAAPVSFPDEKLIREHMGIAFYDPRRAKRYRVTRQSKHDSLKNAIKAISALYGRPPQWVEAFMGETNDLGVIHQNLIA